MRRIRKQTERYYTQCGLTLFTVYLFVFHMYVYAYSLEFACTAPWRLLKYVKELPYIHLRPFSVIVIIDIILVLAVLCRVKVVWTHRNKQIIASYFVLLITSFLLLAQGFSLQFGLEISRHKLYEYLTWLKTPPKLPEKFYRQMNRKNDIRYYEYLLEGPKRQTYTGTLAKCQEWFGPHNRKQPHFVLEIEGVSETFDDVYVICPEGTKIPNEYGKKLILTGKPEWTQAYSESVKGYYYEVEILHLENWRYAE